MERRCGFSLLKEIVIEEEKNKYSDRLSIFSFIVQVRVTSMKREKSTFTAYAKC